MADRMSGRNSRRFYDRVAPAYDAWLGHYERWMGLQEIRRRLLAEASGATLELGVGTGINLPLYPPGVELTAIDLSPRMLQVARDRASRLGMHVAFGVDDASRLPYADESFDTAVATLVLSAVPRPRAAIAETLRVLRPGGRFLVLDHVASDSAPVRLLQRAVDPVLARFAHWHPNRTPSEALAEGFVIERRRRTHLGMIEELVGRKPV